MQPYDRAFSQRVPRPSCNAFDIHQWQIDESKRQGNPPVPRGDIGGPPTPAAQSALGTPMVDFAFYLDSLNKDVTTSTSQGQLGFSITKLNSFNPLQNIVVASMGSFYFPKIASTSAADYFYFRRVYMQIGNVVQSSSVQGANGATYHFEFNVEDVNGTCVLLTPVKPDYYFQMPIIAISTLFLTFYTPLNFKTIPLPADTLVVQSSPEIGPVKLIILSGGTFADVGTIVLPGVAVFFSSFNSTDVNVNVAMTNPDGVMITGTGLTVPGNIPCFIIGGVSFTGITPATSANMVIGKNRIAFPIRFTCLQSNATNGVIQVHN